MQSVSACPMNETGAHTQPDKPGRMIVATRLNKFRRIGNNHTSFVVVCPFHASGDVFFLLVILFFTDFPRFFRYSMGSRMVDLTLDMLSLIYKANSSYEKVGVLTEFLDRYRMLQMLFRVCVEQKVITERKYASFGLLLEKIGKQATSWKQYNERGMKKQEDKRQ